MIMVDQEHRPEPPDYSGSLLRKAPAQLAAAFLSGEDLLVLLDGDAVLGAKVPTAPHAKALRILSVAFPTRLAVGIPAGLAVDVEAVFLRLALVKLRERLVFAASGAPLSRDDL